MAKTTKRVFVLVKAYPQPSETYQETVCVAGVTETGEFVRLYPIRFRQLPATAKFKRYDLVEVQGERPRDDHRPESFHVDEGSIKVVRRASETSSATRANVWLPYVTPSLEDLRAANERDRVSLGIVKPDDGSVKFSWRLAATQGEGDRAISKALAHQTSLIEAPIKPLTTPEYSFTIKWTSNGKPSKGVIHDWEVQAAYNAYKVRYGSKALETLKREYQDRMTARSLHFFMGTMKAHPTQFIIVGVLRGGAETAGQASLLQAGG